MKSPAELAGFWSRMADLDEEIATTAAEGYACDTLLDDRAEWQREREVLLRKAAEQDAVRALLND